jgi:hypothetical protein
MQYRYQVIEQGTNIYRTHYEGTDAADAMAAWSKCISEGAEYVTLEALSIKEER